MSDDIETFAQKAYEILTDAFSAGQWEEFVGLLGPEVDAILPTPATGRFTGTEGRAKMIEFFSMFTPGSVHWDEVEIVGKTVAADRVVFEDRVKGTVFGEPYEARHCLHFIIRDNKIVGFHEYNRAV